MSETELGSIVTSSSLALPVGRDLLSLGLNQTALNRYWACSDPNELEAHLIRTEGIEPVPRINIVGAGDTIIPEDNQRKLNSVGNRILYSGHAAPLLPFGPNIDYVLSELSQINEVVEG